MGSIRAVTAYAHVERVALADLLAEVGPDAPTLCEGWATRDLAAHLVVRANRPDAAAGIVIRAVAPHLQRVQARAARADWHRLVARVRKRPWWAVLGEESVNRTEYFIHHEDVRRAQSGWQPRELSKDFAEALWGRVGPIARIVLRRTPASVKVIAPGFGTVVAGRGGPDVELTGPPGELLIFLSGRQSHSRVDLSGPSEITEKMRTRRYGV
jgi:uncharacterized protein (TIGR03085 family)